MRLPRLSIAALALLIAATPFAEEPPTAAPPGASPTAPEAPPAPPAPAATPSAAPPAKASGEPASRRISVSAMAGGGSAFGNSYFLVGATVGYRLVAGLVAGLEGQYWMGSSPSIFKLAPQLTYVLALPGGTSPYLGAYYARWFVGSDLPDQSALGGRAGLQFLRGGPVAAGAGVAYEHLLDCTRDCDVWYPEAFVGASF